MHDITQDAGALLREAQAAAYLNFTQRALQHWRRPKIQGGPPFVRISSRAVRYRRSDLDEWIAERVQT